MDGESAAKPGRRPSVAPRRWMLGILAIASVAACFQSVRDGFFAIGERAAAAGPWAVILVALVFAGATLAFVPGAPLAVLAGAWLGLGRGFFSIWLGSILSIGLAFWLGRKALRAWVVDRWGNHHRLRFLDEAAKRQGWKVVLLARMTPGLPFAVLNYALSLTSIRALPAMAASTVGVAPGTLFHVYLGTVVSAADRSPWRWVLWGMGLASAAAVLLILHLTARKVWQEQDRH